MRKAALHNLGCKVNAYETEAMQQLLEEAGYEIVPFQEKADVYVICHQYRGPQVQADAAPGKENESGRSGGGSRLLRAGGRRRAEKGRRYRCDHRQ